MRAMLQLLRRLRYVFRRDQFEQALNEELRFHVEMKQRQLELGGLDPNVAMTAARRAMGNLPLTTNHVRDVWVWPWVQDASQDLRQTCRSLGQSPGFVAVVVLIVALGIGTSTASFSVVNAVLLQPLPYEQPDRLVMIWESNTQLGVERTGGSAANILDWREHNNAFEGMAAWYTSSMIFRDGVGAEMLTNARVTADFFSVVRTAPALGRTFLAEEVRQGMYSAPGRYLGTRPVVVMSHQLWQRRFGGDPTIVGKTVSLDRVAWEVIGVMPSNFGVPSADVDLWIPWDMARSYAHVPRFRTGPPRDARFLSVLTRLRQGVTLSEAQADMDVVAAALELAHPRENLGWRVRLVTLRDELVGESRTAILLLFGAAGVLLLIVCVNVATLLLIRATGRRQEVAVRQALGASRGRLARLFLVESVVLAGLGGVTGLALAVWTLDGLVAAAPGNVPRLAHVAVDGLVLAFTLILTLGAGTFCGLAPSVQGSIWDIGSVLRESTRRGHTTSVHGRRTGRILVVVESALAIVLLVAAGLLIRSFVGLQTVDHGFRPNHLLVVRISLDTVAYATNEEALTYFDQLFERLGAIAGVQSVGSTTALPMSDVGSDFTRPYWRADAAVPTGDAPHAAIRMVRPGYFQTMAIPLIRGDWIDDRHRAGTPRVIMVNERLARERWPEENPVGRRLVIDYQGGTFPYDVIGVVGDVRGYGPRSQPQPEVYIPHAQNAYRVMNVVIRTGVDPEQLLNTVRREVAAIDPSQPAYNLVTMEQLIANTVEADRFAMVVFSLLAGLALVLTSVGIAAVVSRSVTERTHEIGLRLAFGARPRDVLAMVMGEALAPAMTGLAIGVVAALWMTRLMTGLLFGVTPTDPVTFFGIVLMLTTVAVGACYLPASRAVRMDPMVGLKDG